MASTAHYDRELRRLEPLFPSGPRIVVIGSTDFYHADSERTCRAIGQLLAAIPHLTLITGGVEGIGEAVGRSFFEARCRTSCAPQVVHILPYGEDVWDYGDTCFAGSDMSERREILGRVSRLYLVIEGGPGTHHEVQVASSMNATLIPVGRSGGAAAQVYQQMPRPIGIEEPIWATLGSAESSTDATARAVFRVTEAFYRQDEEKVSGTYFLTGDGILVNVP